MKVILENKTAEIVEKKSRFIANVFYVTNVDDAEARLSEIRKKYYDAKHNCFAYIIGKTGDIMKSSDDGEPQGTAGHPMLDILKAENITNCIAIVTRYFGGTLLGTGGLVRAYSDSLKLALRDAKYSNIYEGCLVEFSVEYDDYGKIENVVQNINQKFSNADAQRSDKKHMSITQLESKFEEKIKLKYLVDDIKFDKFKVDISNITKGKVNLENIDKKAYYNTNNKIMYIN